MAELTKSQKQKVKYLLAQEVGQQTIADKLGITRHQVRKLIEEGKKSNYLETEDARNDLKLEDVKNEITRWSEEKEISAFLITQRLKEMKIKTSESSVKRFLRKLRKEVYVPITVKPGVEAQVDFGYLGKFEKDDKQIKVWVFCMVLSYSRYAFYCTVTDQSSISFIRCNQLAFEFFNGVPHYLKIDNLGAGLKEADFYEPIFQQQFQEFLGYYKTVAVTTRICRGQDKGRVESGIKYVKENFLKNLDHRNYEQLIKDLKKWNKYTCNLRTHGTTKKTPNEEFFNREKSALLSLPRRKYEIIEREERTVDNFGHVYFKYCFYSVPQYYAGEKVLVESNGAILRIIKGHKEITRHLVSDKKGIYITTENHKPFYKQLKNGQYYREQLKTIGSSAQRVMELLQAEKPYHWKNMVKGIIALKKAYLPGVIERACSEAIENGHHNYRDVRELCRPKNKDKENITELTVAGGFYNDLSIYDDLAMNILKNVSNQK